MRPLSGMHSLKHWNCGREMPRQRTWMKVRISYLLDLIARYELQNNKQAADAIRSLLRQHRITVDETAIQQIIDHLINP